MPSKWLLQIWQPISLRQREKKIGKEKDNIIYFKGDNK